ncbi:MAG: metallophosphoesterase family protein [Deltaproteobacteria bacterium]|nr:metallophosphoesterase family protein [Deltaproteobacteria bacterium]
MRKLTVFFIIAFLFINVSDAKSRQEKKEPPKQEEKKGDPPPAVNKTDDLIPPWELSPEEFPAWEDFTEKYSLYCMAPFGKKIKKPHEIQIGDKKFIFEGSTARIESKAKPGREIKFGVLSGIKDWHQDTQANLRFFIAEWKKEQVEGIIMGGDLAYEEEDLSNIMKLFAETNLPLYVVVGNNDSRSEFNRVIRKLSKQHNNIINMDMIRILHGDGFDMISLPGYYDKKYTRGSSSCTYKPEDAQELIRESENLSEPVILITHGPMKLEGKDAIDYAWEAGNVGDEHLSEALKEAKNIKFGIMGHILEAGGKANTTDGKLIKQGVYSDTLFLNPGPAQSLGWKMLDGKTSYGMAATFYLKGKKGKYRIIVAPKE